MAVASLAQLIAAPALRSQLSYATRPRSDPTVEHVALIEDLAELPRVPEHAIVLLSTAASAMAGSYRFDVALRTARERIVAALVIAVADIGHLTPTAAAIAERSGTAVLGTRATDRAELAIAIARELAGDAEAALLRAHAAVRLIAAHPADAGPDSLVAHAGAALGVPLGLSTEPEGDGPHVAVTVDGHVEAWISAKPQDGDLALALDIVLHVAAAAASLAIIRARRSADLPIQSREETLSELLSAPEHGRAPIVQRARDLDLPVDGWNVAVRLELEPLDGVGADLHELRLGFSRAALATLRADGGTWHSARSGTALVFVQMHREDPGLGAATEAASAIDRVLVALRSRLSGARSHCGVGSGHAGPAGLLSSAAEARAALIAGRATGRVNHAVPFDSLGLRRTLVEWYASATAQEAVASVLEPLSRLGGAKAERMIQTLHVYLDQQGSMSRTAQKLNLHRNAVAYRVNQIFALLDVDRENPDDLLLLQLACRARKLG
jgi:sugar diacid utilization regulator